MLNILRIQILGFKTLKLESKAFLRDCKRMETILTDDEKCLEAFNNAIVIIDKIINGKHSGNYDRSIAKTVGFSKSIKDHFLSVD